MLDYDTFYHIAGGLAGTIMLAEAAYRSRILGSGIKPLVYSATIMFCAGLVKEVNDMYLIIGNLGDSDIADVVADSLGIYGGFLLEYKMRHASAGKKDSIEELVAKNLHL